MPFVVQTESFISRVSFHWKSDACSKHYKEGLFSPEDLLKVLKSLLIVTEVGSGEYLMPCILEVSDIYPSSPVPQNHIRSSFILRRAQ